MKTLKLEINQNMHLKKHEIYNEEVLFLWSIILPYFICRCEHMNICEVQSNMHVVCWFRIQKREYFLFQQYLNGNFPKLADNNGCHENAGYSLHAFGLTLCFKALVIPYVSASLKMQAWDLHVQSCRCVDIAAEILWASYHVSKLMLVWRNMRVIVCFMLNMLMLLKFQPATVLALNQHKY